MSKVENTSTHINVIVFCCGPALHMDFILQFQLHYIPETNYWKYKDKYILQSTK